jgi:transketolase
VEPLADKLRAFGWHALEIDGHEVPAILAALDEARATDDRPTAIVARTIKGKGVSLFEDKVEWHGKPPGDAELALALEELDVTGGEGR